MRNVWRGVLRWLFVDTRPSSAPVGIWQEWDDLFINGVPQNVTDEIVNGGTDAR